MPINPDDDAEKIRNRIKKITNKDVAIIISDSFGRPFRVGAVGVALGVSGIEPLLDKRGCKDLFGRNLQTTIVGQIDNLASAAQLLMGESNEGLPIILIRGYNFDFKEKTSIKSILRDIKSDLFRKKELDTSIYEILKNRRSYKYKFDTRNVNRKLIEKCIDIARWAPSAHNGQQWRYVILEKDDLRVQLIERMNEKLRKDLEEEGKSEEFIKDKINKTKSNFLDCPYLLLLCLDKKDLVKYPDEKRSRNEFLLGIQSISASAIYLLLAFQAEKLAACWYCAPLFAEQIVINTLELPKSYTPIAFFTVGYPIKKVSRPKRKGLEDILFNV